MQEIVSASEIQDCLVVEKVSLQVSFADEEYYVPRHVLGTLGMHSRAVGAPWSEYFGDRQEVL